MNLLRHQKKVTMGCLESKNIICYNPLSLKITHAGISFRVPLQQRADRELNGMEDTLTIVLKGENRQEAVNVQHFHEGSA